MSVLIARFWAFFRRQDGQGLVEYALILVLVAIVVIAILALLGPAIGQIFSAVGRSIQGGDCPPGQHLISGVCYPNP